MSDNWFEGNTAESGGAGSTLASTTLIVGNSFCKNTAAGVLGTLGEGGALLINHPEMFERAEIIREKGTNRSQFFRGQVDKYTWVDFGSSYLPSELIAAFLWAQMEETKNITQRRMDIWNTYHTAFECLEIEGKARLPITPRECKHNAHMYYLLLHDY